MKTTILNPKSKWTYRKVCRGIVEAFDTLEIHEDMRKPRVGIVGEILVKYMPLPITIWWNFWSVKAQKPMFPTCWTL